MIKISELEAVRDAMTPPDQYKAVQSWNNGGMPLADFAIPGSCCGAAVELLAGDAFGLVATHNACDVLIEIAKAALKWRDSDDEDRSIETKALLDALEQVQ